MLKKRSFQSLDQGQGRNVAILLRIDRSNSSQAKLRQGSIWKAIDSLNFRKESIACLTALNLGFFEEGALKEETKIAFYKVSYLSN